MGSVVVFDTRRNSIKPFVALSLFLSCCWSSSRWSSCSLLLDSWAFRWGADTGFCQLFLGRAPADGYVPHVPSGLCNVINRIHAFLSFLLGVEFCWVPRVTPSVYCSTQLLRACVCARIGSWGRLDHCSCCGVTQGCRALQQLPSRGPGLVWA